MGLSAVENTFAGGGLDRASERRGDAAWLETQRADPAARVMVVRGGEPLLDDNGRLRFFPLNGASPFWAAGEPIFSEQEGDAAGLLWLGRDADGPVFALEARPDAPGAFAELRSVAGALPVAESAMAATARGVFAWGRRHRFCANCGTPTAAVDAGWKRLCPACGAQHFPRTDPVVIMLALHCGPDGERCLLGRNAAWPEGRYSALAGFLEPGESIEDACARELKEESGLTAVRVRYHSSQPWPLSPLGGQLMIGLIAEVADLGAVADGIEIAAVRWFSPAEMRRVLNDQHPEVKAPPAMAIAHQLMRSWVEAAEGEG